MRAAGFVCVFELRFWRSCVSDIQRELFTDFSVYKLNFVRTVLYQVLFST